MIDKRFQSGAILGLTIVIAGASSLPALLLRPAPPDLVLAASMAKIAEPVAPRVGAPPFAKAEPALTTPPPEVVLLEPAPKRVATAVAREAIVTPEPAPRAPARDAISTSFPPVQPVETTGTAPMQSAATPATELLASTTPPRAREKRARAERKAQRAAKRNAVRPALYPMREFFAWRR